MLYCEKCQMLFEKGVCPSCGRSKKVRAPRTDDPCFLVERPQPYSGMLCDVLDQNGIVHIAQGRMGAGLAVRAGGMLESRRIYVRYDQFDAANAIVDELFGEDAPR